MKILTTQQIRDWDQYTIQNEPVSSIDLMERAAKKCVEWILSRHFDNAGFTIFCGKGNNGGDGLAIARILLQNGYKTEVFILESGKSGSEDFEINLKKADELGIPILFISSSEQFPSIQNGNIIIDALFGSGLSKPLDGLAKELVQHINASKKKVISIDIPSGMFVDTSSEGTEKIRADDTVTFQTTKLCFLAAENADYFGNLHVLDIGLHPEFLNNVKTNTFLINEALVKSIFITRKQHHHKGAFGHCLIAGGSFGKMGAALLSAKACLHTGSGLVTSYLPKFGYAILQTALPEAMVITDDDVNVITEFPSAEKFDCVGFGPGMGTDIRTQNAIVEFIKRTEKPLVIDADALNCISLKREAFIHIPPYSVLTLTQKNLTDFLVIIIIALKDLKLQETELKN